MGSRVFVRLFDGEQHRETDDVVLTLPPPPLKWAAVLSAMVAAIDRADDDDDDDEAGAAAAAAVPPERIAKARLFLLPSESQGIVAELNARGLRGIRENDQFVICLNGEDYQKRAEKAQAAEAAGDSSSDSGASAPAAPEIPIKINPLEQPLPSVMAVASGVEYPQPSFIPAVATGAAPTVPVLNTTTPRGMGGFTSLGTAKGNKRYRSISGKMAAIKSLGDKGLISADDRGHLKDLLLNNDSPQLQEALDQYNNTGDFQAVKAILLKELSNPSTKRSAGGDWISETLINDITMTFNSGAGPTHASPASGQTPVLPANPFLYQTSESSGSNSATDYHPSHLGHASSMAMGYAPAHSSAASSPVAPEYTSASASRHQETLSPAYQQHADHSSSSGLMATSDAYVQPQYAQSMYPSSAGLPQVNLPMRNRNSVNLMMKQGGYGAPPVPLLSPTHMDLRYGGAGVYPGQMDARASPSMYAPSSMGYGAPDYSNRMDMASYGVMAPSIGGYSNNVLLQQQQQQYGLSRYPYGPTEILSGGYAYYQGSAGGYNNAMHSGAISGLDKGQLRSAGKWTTAPPMPSYPPACSKEEKKEKIAKWLKKRENRNWSNKPSYPVRHSIAKSRKRGEDGRFITKARLAEMALEAAANGGNSTDGSSAGAGSSGSDSLGTHHLHHADGTGAFDDHDPHMAMASLPPPTSVP